MKGWKWVCWALAVVIVMSLSAVNLTADENKRIKAAYLGVSTRPVSEVLTEQLGLPKNMGLIVEYLDPEGGAKDVLKKNDILLKLNDQLLVNFEQLAVLVRSFNPGDEVELTLKRKNEDMTVKVVLMEKEAPPLRRDSDRFSIKLMPPNISFFKSDKRINHNKIMEEIRKRLDVTNGVQINDDTMKFIEKSVRYGLKRSMDNSDGKTIHDDTRSNMRMNTKIVSVVTIADGGIVVTLSNNGEGKHIRAQRGDKIIYEGPLTEESKKELPEDVRNLIDSVGKINIKTSQESDSSRL